MLKILSIVFCSMVLYAESPMYEAKLISGFSLGFEDTQPTMVQVTIENYGNCNILGEGKLQSDRIYVTLTKMTCYQDNLFRTYTLQNSFIIDKTDHIAGLKTKHEIPTNEKLKALEEYEKLYKNNDLYLHQIRLAELGHWDVKGNQQVLICFGSQPMVKNKISDKNVIVPSGNYGL